MPKLPRRPSNETRVAAGADKPLLPEAGTRCGPVLVTGRAVTVSYDIRGSATWRRAALDRVQIIVALDPVDAVLSWRTKGAWEDRSVGGRYGWMIPAGVGHRARRMGHGRTVTFQVDPDYVREVCAADVEEVAVFDLTMIERFDLLVWQLNKAFAEICLCPKSPSPLFVECIGTVLASTLLKTLLTRSDCRVSRRAGLSVERLKRIVEYIETNLSHDLSRKALAAVARLSLCHFSRMFKISTSHSPHFYVMQRRQMYARELLSQGKLKKAVIATEAGFSDQTHLTRHLRKSPR